MNAPLRLPREASVIPMRDDIFKQARKIALSAENDWPRLLGAAETLSQSPDWTDTSLARHIRTAYSLHLQGLLKPAEQSHFDEAREHRKALAALILGGLAVVALVVAGVV